MNYFRFSCDTNVIISSTFYYRFRNIAEVFKERTYDLSIYIMRSFGRIYQKNNIKFGILTPSTLNEINQRKLWILLRKLEEQYQNNSVKFRTILTELSAVLNKINDNLVQVLKIFQKGKAYFNDTRVKKIYTQVEEMYNDFIKKSYNIRDIVEKKVSNHINQFFSKYFKDEDLKKIEIEKEFTRQSQIMRLSEPNTAIQKKDMEILAEVIYEKKRCGQENPLFRKNFDFYFISEDTHFSKKYSNKFGGTISQPITDKINKLFDVRCVRIGEFFDLILQQQLNVSK